MSHVDLIVKAFQENFETTRGYIECQLGASKSGGAKTKTGCVWMGEKGEPVINE